MKVLTVVLLVLLVLIQFELWLGKRGVREMRLLAQSIVDQKAENQRLEQRNQALAAEVADLREGREAVEERARSEMGMIKRDETFYHIIDRSGAGAD